MPARIICAAAWDGTCGTVHTCNRHAGHIDNVGALGLPGPADNSRHAVIIDGRIIAETYPAIVCHHRINCPCDGTGPCRCTDQRCSCQEYRDERSTEQGMSNDHPPPDA